MKDMRLTSTAAIAALMLVGGCGTLPESQERMENWINYTSYPAENVAYAPVYYSKVQPRAHYDWYYDASSGYYYSPGRRYESSSRYYYAPRTTYYEAPSAQVRSDSFGMVDRIEVIRRGDGNNIAGTLIGGIVGGVIGHQIGSGVGNTAATIAGVAGGAVVGHELQRRARDDEVFRVTVRLDNGAFHTVVVDGLVDLRTGDRVRFEGDRLYRVS
jgi:outer membrane lipoprotein SlyB